MDALSNFGLKVRGFEQNGANPDSKKDPLNEQAAEFMAILGSWLFPQVGSKEQGLGVNDEPTGNLELAMALALSGSQLAQAMPQSSFPAGMEANSGTVANGVNTVMFGDADASVKEAQAYPNGVVLAGLRESFMVDTGILQAGTSEQKFQGEIPVLAELDQYKQQIEGLLKGLSGEIFVGRDQEQANPNSSNVNLSLISSYFLKAQLNVQSEVKAEVPVEFNPEPVVDQNTNLVASRVRTLEPQASENRSAQAAAKGKDLAGEIFQQEGTTDAKGSAGSRQGMPASGQSVLGGFQKVLDSNANISGISQSLEGISQSISGSGQSTPGSGAGSLAKHLAASNAEDSPSTQEGQDKPENQEMSKLIDIPQSGLSRTRMPIEQNSFISHSGGSVSRQVIWDQITVALQEKALSRAPEVTELDIQLHPAELGSIQISVRWEGGQVHLQGYASDTSTGNMLQNNLTELRQSLQNIGVSCGTLQMGFGDSRQNQRQTQQQTPQPRYNLEKAEMTENLSREITNWMAQTGNYRVNVTA